LLFATQSPVPQKDTKSRTNSKNPARKGLSITSVVRIRRQCPSGKA
jgi:hypothetical protein